MNRDALHRLAWVALLLAAAYGLALWQPVRAWYSDVDKLAHGLVFVGVYAALAWALRWKPWALATLALALGAAVEVHQYFLPGFSASLKDWLADAVGITLACGTHLVWQRWRERADAESPGGLLPLAQFQQAVAALPLVSVDWVLTNPAGELLVGQRLNAPARGTWFTPGGRIRKGEPLAAALRRVAAEELGLADEPAGALALRGEPMGAWDHFYPDAAFSPTVPTHYVNLPYAASLSEAEVSALSLPVGEQHGNWQWLPLAQAADTVHEHVKPYVAWLQARAPNAAAVSPFLVHAA
ncbi:MAG: VanZ family protein [Thiobacillus sp.]|nr:VanZ family protein [Thiobacillus sp.]